MSDIVPDTKDWTWVLERACPECRFDAGAFDRDDVGPMVRANAAAWPDVLFRADATQRPTPDVWSALEYACHVRDVFRVYDERLRLMLTEDGPRYPNWDQDLTAVEDGYAEQDPVVVAQARRGSARASPRPSRWSRRGPRRRAAGR